MRGNVSCVWSTWDTNLDRNSVHYPLSGPSSSWWDAMNSMWTSCTSSAANYDIIKPATARIDSQRWWYAPLWPRWWSCDIGPMLPYSGCLRQRWQHTALMTRCPGLLACMSVVIEVDNHWLQLTYNIYIYICRSTHTLRTMMGWVDMTFYLQLINIVYITSTRRHINRRQMKPIWNYFLLVWEIKVSKNYL